MGNAGVNAILEGLNSARVLEGKIEINSDKEYDKAIQFFKNSKPGDKIKLLKDLYYGALNITNDEAVKKYKFKIGNDYGDGTGEYIIPEGTVLEIKRVGRDGSYGDFVYKGLVIEFENFDDIYFEGDTPEISEEEIIKRLRRAKYREEIDEILLDAPIGFVIFIESKYGHVSKYRKIDVRNTFESRDSEGGYFKCNPEIPYSIQDANKMGLYIDIRPPKGMSSSCWYKSINK
jgi:hypothetical protein